MVQTTPIGSWALGTLSMMTLPPTVSIVIPNFNKGRYVEEAVRSALIQGPECEVIVVDDASTDESVSVLLSLGQTAPNLRLVLLTKNRGGSYCRNAGLAQARGSFVVFLDSDDLLGPACITRRLQVVRSSPEHDLWVFPMHVFRDDPESPFDSWIPRPGPHLLHFLSHRIDWQTMQPIWRRSFLVALGGFDESFVRLQDPELHARAILAGARVHLASKQKPDCFLRSAEDRHDGMNASLAQRHVDGAVHFHRTFWGMIAGRQRRVLSGTLLASLASLDYWRRTRRLGGQESRQLEAKLIDACQIPWHRFALQVFCLVNRLSPIRIPGFRRVFRELLFR